MIALSNTSFLMLTSRQTSMVLCLIFEILSIMLDMTIDRYGGFFLPFFFFANSGRFCFFKRTALVLKLDSHNYMLLYIACKKKKQTTELNDSEWNLKQRTKYINYNKKQKL